MRTKWLAAALALIAGISTAALPAAAETAVAIAPVQVSTSLQKALHDQYGAAEAAVLQEAVAERLQRALNVAGATVLPAAPLTVDVSIERAVASHPTRYQMQLNPSLDPMRSISLGGAHLHAVLRGADGKPVDEVDYDHFVTSLQEASPSVDAWSDARVAIDRFSDLIVKSWRRHAGH